MASSSGYTSSGRTDEESTAGLFSRLVDDATSLAKNEIALAKAEARAALLDIKIGLASLATAGVVLLAGLLTLIAAGVAALAQIVELWLSAAIIGAALALVGLLLLRTARRKLANPIAKMDQTQDSLQKDATVVARRT